MRKTWKALPLATTCDSKVLSLRSAEPLTHNIRSQSMIVVEGQKKGAYVYRVQKWRRPFITYFAKQVLMTGTSPV